MRQIRCIDVITSIIRADFLWSAPSSENNSTIRQLLLLFKDFSVQLPFSGSCLSKPHLHWLAMRSFWCHQPQSTRPTPSQHTDHHPLVNMASWFSSKCRKLHFTCLPVVYCHILSNIFIDFLPWTIALCCRACCQGPICTQPIREYDYNFSEIFNCHALIFATSVIPKYHSHWQVTITEMRQYQSK